MLSFSPLLWCEAVNRAEFLYVVEKIEAPANERIQIWKLYFEKLCTIENLDSKSANREGYSIRKGVLDEALISRMNENVAHVVVEKTLQNAAHNSCSDIERNTLYC